MTNDKQLYLVGNFLVDEDGEFLHHYVEDSVVVRKDDIAPTIKANYPNGFWILDED